MMYDKRTIMRMAWYMYDYSKRPWQFEMTFAECLKAAWDDAKHDRI